MLVRLTNMRGVPLDIFDFDFDLTWAALFLNADGKVYGRFHQDPTIKDQEPNHDQPPITAIPNLQTLKGLNHALDAALTRHLEVKTKQEQANKFIAMKQKPALKVEDYPAAQRLPPKACIHCHQVYDFRRQAAQEAGSWKKEEVWVYPEPNNIGLLLETARGNQVKHVAPMSAASRAGLKAGDELHAIGEIPVASRADVQFSLNGAPTQGRLPISWKRGGQVHQSELELAPGWRTTDLSWRWSLKTLGPSPLVYGQDLSPDEKKALGIDPARLAFRQGGFLATPARQAGIQIDDIILGVNHKKMDMNARQFEAFIRVNYQIGDTVIYNILRGKERRDVSVKLPG